jgi:hypothetical protein
MSENVCGEAKEHLIAAAADAGYAVSKRQLAEWHRAGLLPEPEQVYGDRPGSSSVYPVGTVTRVLDLCALRKKWRRDVDVAWGLWWAGYDVPEAFVRGPLEQVAATSREAIRQLRELLGKSDSNGNATTDDDLPDAFFDFFDFVDTMGSARSTRKVIMQARKRVGRERFPQFIQVLVEIMAGTFTGYRVDPVTDTADEERWIVETGLGIARGRTDRLADAGPWLTGDSGVELAALSDFLKRYPLGYDIEAAGIEELKQARDEVKPFFGMLEGLSAVAERMFGRGAFGLAGIRGFVSDKHPRDQAMLILLWRTLRMAGLGEAMQVLLPLAHQWQEMSQPQIEALEQLRTEVPASAELFSPKQIGRGLRSKREQQRRQLALEHLREEHAAELDAFFEERPEVQRAMDAYDAAKEEEQDNASS